MYWLEQFTIQYNTLFLVVCPTDITLVEFKLLNSWLFIPLIWWDCYNHFFRSVSHLISWHKLSYNYFYTVTQPCSNIPDIHPHIQKVYGVRQPLCPSAVCILSLSLRQGCIHSSVWITVSTSLITHSSHMPLFPASTLLVFLLPTGCFSAIFASHSSSHLSCSCTSWFHLWGFLSAALAPAAYLAFPLWCQTGRVHLA